MNDINQIEIDIEQFELALKIVKSKKTETPLEWQFFQKGWMNAVPNAEPHWTILQGHEIRLKPTSILTDEQRAQGWVAWHGGENPAPDKLVNYMFTDKVIAAPGRANMLRWSHVGNSSDIAAYRVVEPEYVDLGPEDVPPGSVVRGNEWTGQWSKCFLTVLETLPKGVVLSRMNEVITWERLAPWKINRSLAVGKWDPTAWEPCRKEKA